MEELYSKEDVMQALVAALMFGEDIGYAAQTECAGRVDYSEESRSHLYPGYATQVTISEFAADLLNEAHQIVWERPIDIPGRYGRTVVDLTGILSDEGEEVISQ